MKIKTIDPVYSLVVDKQYIPLLARYLSFEKVYWKKGKYKKERHTYPKSMILPNGFFFTGFIPRLKVYLESKGISVDHETPSIRPYSIQTPDLPLQLRPDQESIVQKALQNVRGVIKAPTGSGKTVLAGALIGSVENIKVLFLCHTLTLVQQTYTEFEKFGFDVGYLTGSDYKKGDVMVATIQTFSNRPDHLNYDMVIVDEVHRFSGTGGLYYKTLGRLKKAHYRFGLTATLPTETETKLAVEGLIGGLIDEFSVLEGIKKGILAIPKLKFLKVPVEYRIKELSRYPEVYKEGIVKNYARNKLIIKECMDLASRGETSLILISKIEHGEILEEMAHKMGHPVTFIQGASDGEIREKVRNTLNAKKTLTVIATQIWKEGVNIPTLNCVINASGGRSEIAVLQSLGRGLRTADGKTSILLVDFVDLSHHYLISHFGERLSIYSDQGWL